MEKKRLLYLDVLRVFAFLCVVLLHAINPYIIDSILMNYPTWKYSVFLNAFGRMGVPLFMMLTGCLLLNRGGEPPAVLTFYRRRLPRILIPLAVWNVFYFCFLKFGYGMDLTLSGLFADVLNNGTYYHLWYLYQIFGIYLMIPFLDRICRACTKGEVAVLALIAAYHGTVRTFVNGAFHLNLFLFEPLLEGYLGYVLMGYLLSRIKLGRRVTAAAALSLVLGLLLNVYANISASLKSGAVNLIANGGYDLSSYLSAGGLFVLARALLENADPPEKLGRAFSRLSAATYPAYGIHAAVLVMLNEHRVYAHFTLTMLLYTALTALISLAIGLLLRLAKPTRILFG